MSRPRPIGLPADWRVLALTYTNEHRTDGASIAAGLSRAPLFSSGGPAIESAGSGALPRGAQHKPQGGVDLQLPG